MKSQNKIFFYFNDTHIHGVWSKYATDVYRYLNGMLVHGREFILITLHHFGPFTFDITRIKWKKMKKNTLINYTDNDINHIDFHILCLCHVFSFFFLKTASNSGSFDTFIIGL